jgi:hypothetical protein
LTEDTSDFALEVLLEYINAVEAGIAAAKNRIRERKGLDQNPQEGSLPGTDLSSLPWKSYKTKNTAEQDEDGWIFSNVEGAEALLATLKSRGGRATIGAFEYQLQGQNKFIARKATKK